MQSSIVDVNDLLWEPIYPSSPSKCEFSQPVKGWKLPTLVRTNRVFSHIAQEYESVDQLHESLQLSNETDHTSNPYRTTCQLSRRQKRQEGRDSEVKHDDLLGTLDQAEEVHPRSDGVHLKRYAAGAISIDNQSQRSDSSGSPLSSPSPTSQAKLCLELGYKHPTSLIGASERFDRAPRRPRGWPSSNSFSAVGHKRADSDLSPRDHSEARSLAINAERHDGQYADDDGVRSHLNSHEQSGKALPPFTDIPSIQVDDQDQLRDIVDASSTNFLAMSQRMARPDTGKKDLFQALIRVGDVLRQENYFTPDREVKPQVLSESYNYTNGEPLSAHQRQAHNTFVIYRRRRMGMFFDHDFRHKFSQMIDEAT